MVLGGDRPGTRVRVLSWVSIASHRGWMWVVVMHGNTPCAHLSNVNVRAGYRDGVICVTSSTRGSWVGEEGEVVWVEEVAHGPRGRTSGQHSAKTLFEARPACGRSAKQTSSPATSTHQQRPHFTSTTTTAPRHRPPSTHAGTPCLRPRTVHHHPLTATYAGERGLLFTLTLALPHYCLSGEKQSIALSREPRASRRTRHHAAEADARKQDTPVTLP